MNLTGQPDEPDDFEADGVDDNEPFGSCEDCGSDLYPGDDLDYCDQCLWARSQGKGSPDVGGSGAMPIGPGGDP